MSDPASTARTARESLARGLAALQSDPNVPPQLVELAAPIAQSMGALHHIERSNGTQLVPHAGLALENVRAALARLQSQPSNHPAVAIAMEAVASSLGLVHALSQLAAPPQAAAPQAAAFAQQQTAPQQQAMPAQGYPSPQAYAAPAPQQAPRPNVAPMAQTVAAPQQAMQQPQAQYPQTPYAQPQQAPPQQQYAQPVQQQQHVPQQAMPQQAMPQQQGGFAARDPFAAPAPAPAPAPAQHGGANAPATGASGDALYVTADLGAQSPTNFYKGLSGNDIVDHGGLFVSTYMIPKIGTSVRLKVSLPGGYEFEADANVRWARDVRDASSDAPPGFGAQFTNITPEARQLIYRYVRNREPLFHDDL